MRYCDECNAPIHGPWSRFVSWLKSWLPQPKAAPYQGNIFSDAVAKKLAKALSNQMAVSKALNTDYQAEFSESVEGKIGETLKVRKPYRISELP